MRTEALKGLLHGYQFVTHEKWSLSREADDGLGEEVSSFTFPLNSSPLVKKQMLMIWMDIKSADESCFPPE